MLQHPIVRTCLRFLKAWHVFWPDMHTMWCLQCGPIHGVSKIKIIVEIHHSSVILLIKPPLVPSTLCCFAKYASKLTSPTFTFVNEPQMETLSLRANTAVVPLIGLHGLATHASELLQGLYLMHTVHKKKVWKLPAGIAWLSLPSPTVFSFIFFSSSFVKFKFS